MTRFEIVKKVLNHEYSSEVPYFVSFTGEALPQVLKYFNADDIHTAIGNYIYPVSCPWWQWAEIGPEFNFFDIPQRRAKTKGVGSYEDFADKIKWVKGETDCYLLVLIYCSHFEKAIELRGIENFLADLVCAKDDAARLLDTIIQKNTVMLENILDFKEIDGILLGSDWGSQKDLLISPSCWVEMIKPGEQKEYNLIKEAGKDVWIHSCGKIEKILPELVNMGVDVLNPVQPEVMDIRTLKQDYGDKITFYGGISTQRTLPYGSPDDVRKETLEVLDIMSKCGGYIASPAQEIQNDVPLENILAMLEAFKSNI